MRMIGATEIAEALRWPELIDALERMFRDGCEAPPRHHHTIQRADGEATLLIMPAWTRDGEIGIKLVNVFPQNAERGLPAISGLYLLCDGHTGRPLVCLDGAELTRRRTAAASALAVRYLAREDAARLLVVGTGRLAPMVIEAHAATRPIREVHIWGRSPSKAAALAAQYRHSDFDCQPVADLAAAVAAADIISCVTLSKQPLVRGEWLRPGTHLDLIGAFRPDMRETDDECIRRAEVFVDTRAGAAGEAGDLLAAVRSGTFQLEQIRADLADLTRKIHPGRRTPAEITLFKSVGASLEDLAAAQLVWERVAGGSV